MYLRCAGPYTAARTSDKVGVCLHIRHGRVLDTAGGILIHSDSIGDSPRNRIGIIAIRIDSTQNESIRIDSQGYLLAHPCHMQGAWGGEAGSLDVGTALVHGQWLQPPM